MQKELISFCFHIVFSFSHSGTIHVLIFFSHDPSFLCSLNDLLKRNQHNELNFMVLHFGLGLAFIIEGFGMLF